MNAIDNMQAMNNNMPVDETEIRARLIEPEQSLDAEGGVINRNLSLGNLKATDLKWLHDMEVTRQNLTMIPESQGGDIFNRWGVKLSLEKNHYLVLSGSKGGFVRRIEKTNIQSTNVSSSDDSKGISGFFRKRKTQDY